MASAFSKVELKSRGSIVEQSHNSLVSAGALQAPLCRPWDRADLHKRLATFKSMTWFAKTQAAADAKYYGNFEVYNILRARRAKTLKNRKTPMTVANPREVPEYELNPLELQVRKSDGISKQLGTGAGQLTDQNLFSGHNINYGQVNTAVTGLRDSAVSRTNNLLQEMSTIQDSTNSVNVNNAF